MNTRLNGLPHAHPLLQHGVEMPRIEQAGDVVGDGELLDQRHRSGILNRNCGIVAEDAQERDRILRQQVELAVQQLDDAKRLVRRSARAGRRWTGCSGRGALL